MCDDGDFGKASPETVPLTPYEPGPLREFSEEEWSQYCDQMNEMFAHGGQRRHEDPKRPASAGVFHKK